MSSMIRMYGKADLAVQELVRVGQELFHPS